MLYQFQNWDSITSHVSTALYFNFNKDSNFKMAKSLNLFDETMVRNSTESGIYVIPRNNY